MKQRYRDYNSYLREIFGERVQKISIDAGFDCPNRDAKYETFAVNANLGAYSKYGTDRLDVLRLTQLKRPSRQIFVAPGSTVGSGGVTTGLGNPNNFPNPTNHFPLAHGTDQYGRSYGLYGSANIVFHDGHVEIVRWSDNWLTSKNVDND